MRTTQLAKPERDSTPGPAFSLLRSSAAPWRLAGSSLRFSSLWFVSRLLCPLCAEGKEESHKEQGARVSGALLGADRSQDRGLP